MNESLHNGHSTALGRNNKFERSRAGRPENLKHQAHVAQDYLIHDHERSLTFENLTELPGHVPVRVKASAFIAGKSIEICWEMGHDKKPILIP